MAITIKIGDEAWHKGVSVIVLTEPDIRDKVTIKRSHGSYSLIGMRDLQLPPTSRFHAWRNKNTLTVRKTNAYGNYTHMTFPKEILPALRRVMFSSKAAIRTSMEPEITTEPTDDVDDDSQIEK